MSTNSTRRIYVLVVGFLVLLPSYTAWSGGTKDNLFFDAIKEERWIEAKDLISKSLDKGADINNIWKDGQSPLHWAVSLGAVDVVDFLIKKGADVNLKTNMGQSALHLLSCVDDPKASVEIANLLIENHANLDAIEPIYQTTPIFWQNKEVVQVLINHGADIYSSNPEGYTPIFWQANSDANDVVELLIDNGTDIHSVLSDGTSLLHMAVELENISLVRLLIEKGINVNLKDSFGWTPLHFAAKEDNEQIIRYLLQHKAQKRVRTKKTRYNFSEGVTPRDISRKMGATKKIQQLLK